MPRQRYLGSAAILAFLFQITFTREIYLILEEAHEGISKWSHTVQKFIRLSYKIPGSLLVEPCFLGGRLTSCTRNNSTPLSYIFDFEGANISFVSWKNYSSRTQSETRLLCFKRNIAHHGIYDLKTIKERANNLRIDYSDDSLDSIADCAVNMTKNRDFPGNVSIFLFSPWLEQMSLKKFRFQEHEQDYVGLEYSKHIYHHLHRILKEGNISLTQAVVFNWRSETIRENNYESCAKYLVNSISSHVRNRHEKPILVSDISLSPSIKLWGLMRNINISNEVVDSLRRNFFKLETSQYLQDLQKNYTMYNDILFLSVWDTIIARSARLFVTCNDRHNAKCLKCTRVISNFVREILYHRNAQKKKSSIRW